jgi:hypothetical protein
MLENENNINGLRVIKTARDEESINEAARNGFFPLVKKVIPSPEIRSKYSVLQNRKTGEIKVIGDYRAISPFPDENEKEFEQVIGWTFYYPYSFESPYAAYLIPRDIKIGERVFIEELIEDYIGSSWNQGDCFREWSCEAIWTGSDLEIQYDASATVELIG